MGKCKKINYGDNQSHYRTYAEKRSIEEKEEEYIESCRGMPQWARDFYEAWQD